jgi:multiple sugar transport system permease protein
VNPGGGAGDRATPGGAVGGRRRVDLLPYALIAPITALLLAVSLYPGLYAIRLALTDASLLRPAQARFVGLQNFARMAGDPVFLQGLWRTARWDAAVVLTQLAIALPVALFLNLGFRGRGVVRAVVVPYVIPPAATALLWVYMFDGTFGVANDLMMRLGLLGQYVPWLSDPGGSFAMLVAAMVWSGQSLMVISPCVVEPGIGPRAARDPSWSLVVSSHADARPG